MIRNTILILLLSTTTGLAQYRASNDLLQFPADTDQIPQKAKPKIIKPLAIGLGYTALGVFTYRYLDDDIKKFSQKNQNKIATDFFKTIGHAGLGKSSIIITAGTGISAIITRNQKLEKATILLIGAHLMNDLITHQSKITFQRHRPNTGDPYNTFDWRGGSKKNKSFISSHTSNAFTTATVFAICFKNKKWVPIVAYSIASMVGLSRIYQNEHWTSDVLAGAAVGYLSAQVMNKLYNIAGKRFTFLPDVGLGHYGAFVSYSFK